MEEDLMFYCDPCAEAFGYPESFSKSRGKCECCGNGAICNDRPSSSLPMPKSVKSEEDPKRQLAVKVTDLILGLRAHDFLAGHADDPCQRCLAAGLRAVSRLLSPEQALLATCPAVQEAVAHVHQARESMEWMLNDR